MTKYQIKQVNTETGEEITREATVNEAAQIEADAIESVAIKAADEKAATDKELARQAVFTKLGLTAEEMAALLA
jgi:hypothetical protein